MLYQDQSHPNPLMSTLEENNAVNLVGLFKVNSCWQLAMIYNHNLNHSQNHQLELDLERLAEDSMNSLVSHSLNVKMASSANQQEVSVFQALEISVKNLKYSHSQNQNLELDLEKLAGDSMNSPVSRSLNVRMASSANQQEVPVFQALEISAKNLKYSHSQNQNIS